MEALSTEIRALVGRLNNLHEIFRVQGEILLYGEKAVEPLVELLLSPPSVFPEPRVAAAECLGAIGGDKAVDGLIRVLDDRDLQAIGPVQRLAEETVRNAAARQLARFHHARVINALLFSLKRDHLIGAGEALGALDEAAAIPYLIECLEDDAKKYRATEALLSFGQAAVPYLEDTLSKPRWVEGTEPPLSQERRARAAELLGQLGAREAIPVLQAGIRDACDQVRIASAIALAGFRIATEEVLCHVVAGLDDPDLLVRVNCEEALQRLGSMAVACLARAATGCFIKVKDKEFCLSLSGRLIAIRLLGSIQDTGAVSGLIRLLMDPEEIVRYRSVAALKNFHNDQVRKALERVGRADSSKRVSTKAKEVLQSLPKEKGIV